MIMDETVETGQWRIARAPEVLHANGLGSCVAVCLYASGQQLGALGHLMLPGERGQTGSGDLDRFVASAIRRMVEALREAGVEPGSLVAKIAGGGNLFENENQTLISGIGSRNARSARQILTLLGIPVLAEDIGGNRERSVSFDLASGEMIVYCASDNLKQTF